MTLNLAMLGFTFLTAALAWLTFRMYSPTRTMSGPSPELPQIPPADPLVLCPKCGLMGHHSLDYMPPGTNRVIELPDGDLAEVYTWSGGVREHYRRECVFCEHVWSVPVPKEEAP